MLSININQDEKVATFKIFAFYNFKATPMTSQCVKRSPNQPWIPKVRIWKKKIQKIHVHTQLLLYEFPWTGISSIFFYDRWIFHESYVKVYMLTLHKLKLIILLTRSTIKIQLFVWVQQRKYIWIINYRLSEQQH